MRKKQKGQLKSTTLNTHICVKYQHGNGAENAYTFTSLIPTIYANYVAVGISDL